MITSYDSTQTFRSRSSNGSYSCNSLSSVKHCQYLATEGTMDLFNACKRGANFDEIQNILEYRHESVFTVHPLSKRTCLHVLCSNCAPSNVIELIAHAWPSATVVKDIYGRTPLHIACMWSSISNKLPKKTMHILCRTGKGALQLLDSTGLTPIQLAMENQNMITDEALDVLGIYNYELWWDSGYSLSENCTKSI